MKGIKNPIAKALRMPHLHQKAHGVPKKAYTRKGRCPSGPSSF